MRKCVQLVQPAKTNAPSAASRFPKPSAKKSPSSTDGGATTIARVTCPTAPKFWRWRDLPFPRIEPREIEIQEEDEHRAQTNGNGNWPPRFSAAYVAWPAMFGRAEKFKVSCFRRRLSGRRIFSRRKKSGNAFKSACWTFIF